MNNQELIKKILQRALDNGWNGIEDDLMGYFFDEVGEVWPDGIVIMYGEPGEFSKDFGAIMFDIDFAKTFFGEKETETIWEKSPETCCGENRNIAHINVINEGWQYHLQQLAITENRLEYLENFL